jgi:hypothetical protein
LAPDVGESDGSSFQGYFADLARRNVGSLRDVHKRHGCTFERVSLHGICENLLLVVEVEDATRWECFQDDYHVMRNSCVAALAKLFRLLGLGLDEVAACALRGIQGCVGTAYQRCKIGGFLFSKTGDSEAGGYGDFFVANVELMAR